MGQVLDFIGRQTGACLFIDEADALLGDRQAAADSQAPHEVRQMKDVLEEMVRLDAQRQASGTAPGQVALGDYVASMLKTVPGILATRVVGFVQTSERASWQMVSYAMLYERLWWLRPRARL